MSGVLLRAARLDLVPATGVETVGRSRARTE